MPVLLKIKKFEQFKSIRIFVPKDTIYFIKSQGLVPEILEVHQSEQANYNNIARIFEHTVPDAIITGSSPRHNMSLNSPEGLAISLARSKGIPSLAVLDYWGMYKERFCSENGMLNQSLIPDALCALDLNCKKDLISLGIPSEQIHITHNPWLDRVSKVACSDKILNKNLGKNFRAAFISQPLKQFISQYGADLSFKILSKFIHSFPAGGQHQLFILGHPAESPENWKNLGDTFRGNVNVSVTQDRSSKFLQSLDFVATVYSTFAYEILHLGIPCFSLRYGFSFPELYSDRIGLTKTIESTNELQKYFEEISPAQLCANLLVTKKNLLREKTFFSDGYGTDRVINRLKILLN